MFNELFPPEVKILGHWRIVNMFLNKLLSSLKKRIIETLFEKRK